MEKLLIHVMRTRIVQQLLQALIMPVNQTVHAKVFLERETMNAIPIVSVISAMENITDAAEEVAHFYPVSNKTSAQATVNVHINAAMVREAVHTVAHVMLMEILMEIHVQMIVVAKIAHLILLIGVQHHLFRIREHFLTRIMSCALTMPILQFIKS